MTFKEQFQQERQELKDVKRPYETAAFIIFAVMLIQQLGYWVLRLLQFNKNGFMNINLPTTPAFVRNIVSVDTTKWIWVLAGLLGLVVWYSLIYLLVWNYCRKQGYAKWIWTTLIAFGPGSIFLVPTYLIYAVYVFRPYLFRFIRRGVDEYKAYDSSYAFKEEVQTSPPDQSNDSTAQE